MVEIPGTALSGAPRGPAVGASRGPAAAGAASAAVGAARGSAARGAADDAADDVAGGPGFDADLFEKIKRNTRVLAADGAKPERRHLFLACSKFFLRVGMVIRDPAHAIRISTQQPLELEEEFGKVYEELIGKSTR